MCLLWKVEHPRNFRNSTKNETHLHILNCHPTWLCYITTVDNWIWILLFVIILIISIIFSNHLGMICRKNFNCQFQSLTVNYSPLFKILMTITNLIAVIILIDLKNALVLSRMVRINWKVKVTSDNRNFTATLISPEPIWNQNSWSKGFNNSFINDISLKNVYVPLQIIPHFSKKENKIPISRYLSTQDIEKRTKQVI